MWRQCLVLIVFSTSGWAAQCATAQFRLGDDEPTVADPTDELTPYDHRALELGLARGWIPSGQAFEPLIADPRWPVGHVGLQTYIDDDNLGDGALLSIGISKAMWRVTGGPWMLEAGGQGAVFPIFDLTAGNDMLNADYMGAAYFSARKERFSLFARLRHVSTHIGDEFLIREDAEREDFGFEQFDFIVSQDFFGDYGTSQPRVRAYGGVGWIPGEPYDPDWGKGSFIWGLEATGDKTFGLLRPVFAVNVKQQEGRNFAPDVSVRTGLQLDSESGGAGSTLRLMLEYYYGREVNGQFWEDDLQYVGLGFFLHI